MTVTPEPASPAKRPSLIAWVIRAVVSVAALALVFSFVDPHAVIQALVRVGPVLWLGILVVYLLGHVLSAYKWRMLADPHGPFPQALRAHFSGLAANIALPGAASGDIVRAGLLYGRSADRARLAVGSMADRLIDTVGIVILCLLGLLQVRSHFDAGIVLWLGLAVAAALAAALTARPLLAKVSQLVSEQTPLGQKKLGRLVRKLADAGLVLCENPGRLLFCLITSMAIQAVFIIASAVIGHAAGLKVALPVWFIAWPLSKLIATIPISAGGIGVREASLAGIMSQFGVDPAGVVAAGLAWQSVVIVGGLLGSMAVWAMRGADLRGEKVQ